MLPRYGSIVFFFLESEGFAIAIDFAMLLIAKR